MRTSAPVASDVGANGPVAVAAAPPRTKVLDHLCDALRSRHYSRRTEQTYCLWVRRFIYFHRLRHSAPGKGRGDHGSPPIPPAEL